MKKKSIALMLASALALFSSCSSTPQTRSSEYQNISSEKAHEIMTTESNTTILDVRNEEEYNSGHIANAILLPYDQISEKAESVLVDKNKKILVYCHSGRRSAIAAKELISLGYTNVLDFGGITDWTYGITAEYEKAVH